MCYGSVLACSSELHTATASGASQTDTNRGVLGLMCQHAWKHRSVGGVKRKVAHDLKAQTRACFLTGRSTHTEDWCHLFGQ